MMREPLRQLIDWLVDRGVQYVQAENNRKAAKSRTAVRLHNGDHTWGVSDSRKMEVLKEKSRAS